MFGPCWALFLYLRDVGLVLPHARDRLEDEEHREPGQGGHTLAPGECFREGGCANVGLGDGDQGLSRGRTLDCRG